MFGTLWGVSVAQTPHFPARHPVSLSFVSMSDGDILPNDKGYGHGQGVALDETYLWYSGNNVILKTYLDKPDWAHPLVINNHPVKDGYETDQINFIHVVGNYIYAIAPRRLKTEYRCFVKWWDKDTLNFVGEAELWWEGKELTERSLQEGIGDYGGYWWTVSWATPWVTKYDSDWKYAGTVDLLGQQSEIQGLLWYDDFLFVNRTRWPLRVYHYDGQKFEFVSRLEHPSQIENGQGFAISEDGNYLYMASVSIEKGVREGVDKLIKCRINWEK